MKMKRNYSQSSTITILHRLKESISPTTNLVINRPRIRRLSITPSQSRFTPTSSHHLHSCRSIDHNSNDQLKPSTRTTKRPIIWAHLNHLVKYRDGHQLQNELVRHKIDHPSSPDWLLLLQHQPVYTTGRRQATRNHHHPHGDTHGPVELETSSLANLIPKADVFPTLRGGQTTFHGPGQLVVYPILNLSLMNWNTRAYVDFLMSLLRSLLLHPSLPRPIETLDPKDHQDLPVGIFIKSESTKVASVGVQIRRRITSHGFALNVERQSEEGFKFIVACGLKNTRLISLQSVLEEQEDPLRQAEKRPVNQPIKVLDLILPTIELFGELSGREMKEMDETCQELDPIGYQLVHQFIHSKAQKPTK